MSEQTEKNKDKDKDKNEKKRLTRRGKKLTGDLAEIAEVFDRGEELVREVNRAKTQRKRVKKQALAEGATPEEAAAQAQRYPIPQITVKRSPFAGKFTPEQIITLVEAILENTDPITGGVDISGAAKAAEEKGLKVTKTRMKGYVAALQDSPIWQQIWDSIRVPLLKDLLDLLGTLKGQIIARAADKSQLRWDKMKDLVNAYATLLEKAQALGGADVVRHEVEVKAWKPEVIEIQPLQEAEIVELQGEE